MHEFAICENLLKQVSGIVAEHNGSGVDSIHLQVGPLSGVVPELLRSAFPIAAANTVAAGAQLVIHQAPVRVHCQHCHAESEASPNRLLCAACGDWHTQLLSGDELLLERVELKTEH
ncbi:MAG: hydrogenase maturation nickel metallochaperone HypA [Granulosicoccaceae bacterium]|jgi:hydrogenase nickel incorporation protein HypA/HybF